MTNGDFKPLHDPALGWWTATAAPSVRQWGSKVITRAHNLYIVGTQLNLHVPLKAQSPDFASHFLKPCSMKRSLIGRKIPSVELAKSSVLVAGLHSHYSSYISRIKLQSGKSNWGSNLIPLFTSHPVMKRWSLRELYIDVYWGNCRFGKPYCIKISTLQLYLRILNANNTVEWLNMSVTYCQSWINPQARVRS